TESKPNTALSSSFSATGMGLPGPEKGKTACTPAHSLLTSCAARRLTPLGQREQPAPARSAGTSSRRCDVLFPTLGVSLAEKPAASMCARAHVRAGRSPARFDRNGAQHVCGSGHVARPSDRALPRRHLALAAGHERAAPARLVHLPTRSEPPLPALGPQPLARAGGADAAAGAPPAEPRRL